MVDPSRMTGGAVRNRSPLAIAAFSAVCVFAADQLSKWWALDVLGLREALVIQLAPMLKFVLAYNTGVNFGLFASGSPLQLALLAGFAIVVSGALMVWSARTDDWRLGLGCGLVVGGALANALDRLRVGAVIDFINLDCCGIGNPYAFNLADCAIFLGAAAIALTAWREKQE